MTDPQNSDETDPQKSDETGPQKSGETEPKRNGWKILLKILSWSGLTSLAGIGFLITVFYSYPPEIIVESTFDPFEDASGYSRIKITNTGLIPAVNIRPRFIAGRAITKNNFVISNLVTGTGELHHISRLTRGEHTTIPITVGIVVSDYKSVMGTLEIEYTGKIFILSKLFKKSWRIKLMKSGDKYHWVVERM